MTSTRPCHSPASTHLSWFLYPGVPLSRHRVDMPIRVGRSEGVPVLRSKVIALSTFCSVTSMALWRPNLGLIGYRPISRVWLPDYAIRMFCLMHTACVQLRSQASTYISAGQPYMHSYPPILGWWPVSGSVSTSCMAWHGMACRRLLRHNGA